MKKADFDKFIKLANELHKAIWYSLDDTQVLNDTWEELSDIQKELNHILRMSYLIKSNVIED